LVLHSRHKTEIPDEDQKGEQQFPLPRSRLHRAPRIVFGLVPLTTPYVDSDLELRVLNAVSLGLLYESTKNAAPELGMTKAEFNRVLKSLRNSGQIFLSPEGKYQLTFDKSNFPNLVARE
jgi:hypothetical protein